MTDTRAERAAAASVRTAELAAKFVGRSVADLATMRASLARFYAGETDALADIVHLAHRMYGTGATLGFEGLGDCAMRIERLARAPVVGGNAAAAAALEDELGRLGTELARLGQAAD